MNKDNSPISNLENEKIPNTGSHLYRDGKDKIEELYAHTKNKANKLYEEGKRQIDSAEDQFKLYSDQLIKTVQEKPLTSLLIAGGIGFILSSLIRK